MRSLFGRSRVAPSVPEAAQRDHAYDTLARNLESIASATRLELLHALRTPRTLRDIHVQPSLNRTGESPDRPMSRQGVTRHLDQLLDVGLVRRTSPEESGSRDAFVLNHERLFALIDELRNLAKLRPVFLDEQSLNATIDGTRNDEHRLPEGPRLLVAYGRDDGVAYALSGPVGTRWRIGRAPGSEVRLDYDPYVSAENTVIERTAEGFLVRDRVGNRNGSWINWRRLSPGASAKLSAGDIVTVGRTTLVFQS
jgi:DNA-binding transcriptional ArsR family regulator